MESKPSTIKNGVLFLKDEYHEFIKPNIEYIENPKNKINIDRVPYLKVWKEKVIYILMVLFNFNNSFQLYINIPNEIIRLISYNYLNILKIINIKSIHKQNICPCDERICLLEWFDFYSIIASPSQGDLLLFHCDVIRFEEEKCHFIGITEYKGLFCYGCERYCCDNCIKESDEKYIEGSDSDSVTLYLCIECLHSK